MPLLTVIVPLYNKANTVSRSLLSIAKQTFVDFEVIIVNDGSTDDSVLATEACLTSLADPRFRLIHQENQGPGAARNCGISHSQGEILAFLDADDEWAPHFLTTAVSLLQSAGPDAATASLAWNDLPGMQSIVPRMHSMGLKDGIFPLNADTPPAQLVALMTFMSPCTTVVRKTFATRYGGFRENRCRYGEDIHLWLKVALNHPSAIALVEAAFFHRDQSGLSGNYRGMRPIEPFLEDPVDIRRHCPPALLPLLEAFLCIRAMKTACVLAYWGDWRAASKLRSQFLVAGSSRLPWFYPSLLAASLPGSWAGRLARSFR